MKAIVGLLLVTFGGCTILEQFTLGVWVGDEYEFLIASPNDFAGVFDLQELRGFDYRVEAVDGGPVMRADHSGLIGWVPVVLLAGGEHTLTIGKGKRGMYDPPETEYSSIIVTVEVGKTYELDWRDGSLILQER